MFSFVMAAERDPDFAAELPGFIAEIRRLFTAQEIHTYLDELERTKFLAPGELDGEHDPDDEAEEEPSPDNPVSAPKNCSVFPVSGGSSRNSAHDGPPPASIPDLRKPAESSHATYFGRNP